ncbi:hypothetical protein PAPYR_8915 [Paratrimastix pyriformis]|uniref:Uncharacterized protein n=1 Tax=Paratrimastix pyriformis TaxID=342808 RepID=A0ABQ8U9L3_9EUKA|nr:hypothetical protein PAPYR_8915 [Paratrimastix pyriformis]
MDVTFVRFLLGGVLTPKGHEYLEETIERAKDAYCAAQQQDDVTVKPAGWFRERLERFVPPFLESWKTIRKFLNPPEAAKPKPPEPQPHRVEATSPAEFEKPPAPEDKDKGQKLAGDFQTVLLRPEEGDPCRPATAITATTTTRSGIERECNPAGKSP